MAVVMVMAALHCLALFDCPYCLTCTSILTRTVWQRLNTSSLKMALFRTSILMHYELWPVVSRTLSSYSKQKIVELQVMSEKPRLLRLHWIEGTSTNSTSLYYRSSISFPLFNKWCNLRPIIAHLISQTTNFFHFITSPCAQGRIP